MGWEAWQCLSGQSLQQRKQAVIMGTWLLIAEKKSKDSRLE